MICGSRDKAVLEGKKHRAKILKENGYTNTEIALFLSTSVTNIYRWIGLSNRKRFVEE